MIEPRFVEIVAQETQSRPEQVTAAIALFDKGATVPFVARYRKDATGNLDEVKLERIQERNVYFTALINRRDAVLDNVSKQGKLTDELRERIASVTDHLTLEDLYLPFKKQRRTKADMAKEKGLQPLAEYFWIQEVAPEPLEQILQSFVDPEKGVNTPEEALEGARHIIAAWINMDPDVRSDLRQRMLDQARFTAVATKNAEGQKTKFEAYYDFSEPLKSIPSHRLLAVLRGERLGILRTDLVLPDEEIIDAILARYLKERGSFFEEHLRYIVTDSYKRLLRPSIENEVVSLVRERAEEEAINVFRQNAENLLLSPPAGQLVVLGVDPGLRTGCKMAVVDDTGTYRDSATIWLLEPDKDEEAARKRLLELVEQYGVQGVAVGNGTGSREAAQFINKVLQEAGKGEIFCIFVNEAGASIYSASKVARDEFPDLDITIRGAISIARRLQDPLAELVKLEPRSVGVGQYQHDVNQRRLREQLYRSVETSVNRVGVDLNTASVELLRYVSGIQMGTAQNIIEFRTQNGGFKNRQQLIEVSGIGEKTFEQCAGFLRIRGGEEPLDATAIHPEAYPVVQRAAEQLSVSVSDLIGAPEMLDKVDLRAHATETVGEYTLADIRQELVKPGRDPRQQFKVPQFIEGVTELKDLEEGMETEGVITNVTDFGAFIDVGVHQDGLVHLSEMANRFVRDPREVVKVGDVVRVKVIKVDPELSRISLSMKALLPEPAPRRPRRQPAEAQPVEQRRQQEGPAPQAEQPKRRPRRQDKDAKRDRKPKRREQPQREAGKGRPGPSDVFGSTMADQLAALRDELKD